MAIRAAACARELPNSAPLPPSAADKGRRDPGPRGGATLEAPPPPRPPAPPGRRQGAGGATDGTKRTSCMLSDATAHIGRPGRGGTKGGGGTPPSATSTTQSYSSSGPARKPSRDECTASGGEEEAGARCISVPGEAPAPPSTEPEARCRKDGPSDGARSAPTTVVLPGGLPLLPPPSALSAVLLRRWNEDIPTPPAAPSVGEEDRGAPPAVAEAPPREGEADRPIVVVASEREGRSCRRAGVIIPPPAAAGDASPSLSTGAGQRVGFAAMLSLSVMCVRLAEESCVCGKEGGEGLGLRFKERGPAPPCV